MFSIYAFRQSEHRRETCSEVWQNVNITARAERSTVALAEGWLLAPSQVTVVVLNKRFTVTQHPTHRSVLHYWVKRPTASILAYEKMNVAALDRLEARRSCLNKLSDLGFMTRQESMATFRARTRNLPYSGLIVFVERSLNYVCLQQNSFD